MKVLHCPEIVGGNAQELARAEREIGLDSIAISLRQSNFGYKSDEIVLAKSSGRIRFELARWRLFARALSFDVLHFNFGQSIMPTFRRLDPQKFSWWQRICVFIYSYAFELFDVKLFALLGRVIVVTFQGDDARQGDYCRKNFTINFANEVDNNYYDPVSDQLKRDRIAKFAKYADRIFALNPDLLHMLPKQAEFLPYCHIDIRKWQVVEKKIPGINGPVVLHAPSHRGVKGTRFVLDAVARLKSEGVQFEFVMVEGLTNEEARKRYETADLLIDQLLAGWYGGLAVELMALETPVIAYIRNQDLQFIPMEMKDDLPIIQATPDELYETLKYWLTDGLKELEFVGKKSRAYVEKWHDPVKIAKKMRLTYEQCVEAKAQKND